MSTPDDAFAELVDLTEEMGLYDDADCPDCDGKH